MQKLNAKKEKLRIGRMRPNYEFSNTAVSFDNVCVWLLFESLTLVFSPRTYDALIGIVTHDFFDELSDKQVRHGLSLQQRDKMLQTFVRNHYNAHLQEILLTLQNEYTDWTQQASQHPSNIKEQVSWNQENKNISYYQNQSYFRIFTVMRLSKNCTKDNHLFARVAANVLSSLKSQLFLQ